MSERAIADPSQHGWVEVDGKWKWDVASGGGGSIQDGDSVGDVTVWDGAEWVPNDDLQVRDGFIEMLGNRISAYLGNGGTEAAISFKEQDGTEAIRMYSDEVGNLNFWDGVNGILRMQMDVNGDMRVHGRVFSNGVELGGGGGGDSLWTDNGDGSISYSGTAKATDFVAE